MLKTYDIFDDILDLKGTINSFLNTRTNRGYYTNPPLVNIYEKDDKITVKALVPGVAIEDINLELTDGNLNITVNKKNDHQEKEKYIREERSFGEFKKTVKIPYKINNEKIDASLAEGVLFVTLEKSEDAKPKKITIH